MAQREIESLRRAQSNERKSALPVPLATRHQRSSSVGHNVQNIYCTPLVRQTSGVCRSSSRNTSSRKYLGNVQLPIGDKEFRASALAKVRSYLQRNSCINIPWSSFGTHPLSVANYVEMFNFLLKKIFKSTNLDTKNYVDELPRLMKLLSYPVNLQKSSLHTINTKNSWPNVLSMLVFLVDLVSILDESVVSEIICPDMKDNKSAVTERAKFWHHIRLYKIWNDSRPGEDDRKMEEANQSFLETLRNQLHVDEADYNVLVEDVNQLKSELQTNGFIDMKEEVQGLQVKCNQLHKDERKIQVEINRLVTDEKEKQRKLEEVKKKLHALEEYNKRKKDEIQKLNDVCMNQEMNVEEKQKNQQECLEVKERMKLAEDLCITLKETSYKTDQEIAKLKAKVDNHFKEFKKFQCEKGNVSEISALNIESRYSSEDWKFVKNKLQSLAKQLLSKKFTSRKCFEEQRKEVSLVREQLEQLLEDERNGKSYLKELERCIQNLKSDIKEICTNVSKKEEDSERKDMILREENSHLENLKTEVEECKKRYTSVTSLNKSKIEEENAKVKYMADTYAEIKKEFMAGIQLFQP